MAGLKIQERDGVYYATGTIDGERIRKSLNTRDKAQAVELCALYEAKLWKRSSYAWRMWHVLYRRDGTENFPKLREAAVRLFQNANPSRGVQP